MPTAEPNSKSNRGVLRFSLGELLASVTAAAIALPLVKRGLAPFAQAADDPLVLTLTLLVTTQIAVIVLAVLEYRRGVRRRVVRAADWLLPCQIALLASVLIRSQWLIPDRLPLVLIAEMAMTFAAVGNLLQIWPTEDRNQPLSRVVACLTVIATALLIVIASVLAFMTPI